MMLKAYMYDIARGAYLKPENFKQVMRVAADSGYTHFIAYLENMIALPSVRKACPVSAYTAEQWQEFDAAAADAGIELIPHFNIIGHTKQICKVYPELAGESESGAIDPTLEITQSWTRRCLEEFCAFSNGRHFLMGGDEWQTPNHLLARADCDPGKIWVDHVNFAAEVLAKHGRIPIVWHDMLMHYPQALQWLSKDVVVAFWFYDEDSDYPFLRMLKEMGFNAIMASGICSGLLTDRRRRAIEKAAVAADEHQAYGMMVTAWTDGRWEKQNICIKLSGRILRGEPVPEIIPRTISLIERLATRRSAEGEDKQRAEVDELMLDTAWAEYPEFKRYVNDLTRGDREAETRHYLERHAEEGPLYWSIKTGRKHNDGLGAEPVPPPFSFNVKSMDLGEELRVVNGDESFAVYPRYGATLQNYFKGDREIIPWTLPKFVSANQMLPGGYRSYTGVGGFRPVWGFGSHFIPCILWNGPFKWSETEKAGIRELRLSRELYHVSVEYTIRVERGRSGFEFGVSARNHVAGAYGAWSFNFPLRLRPGERERMTLSWDDGRLRPADSHDRFLTLPPTPSLTIGMDDVAIAIETLSEGASGFYMDGSDSMITPDSRGKYRKLHKDETSTAKWRIYIADQQIRE